MAGGGPGAVGSGVTGPAATGAATPVFGSIEGGLSTLVEAAAAASGADVRLGRPVRELRRTAAGWTCVVGDTRDPDVVECDAVVLATPARPARRLLADVDAAAAAELGALDYASVGLVTIAYAGIELPHRSGFLVPETPGRSVKAATFFTRKWPQSGGGGISVIRVSMGRYGEEQVLQHEDSELVATAHSELSEVIGMPLPPAVESQVHRWGGGLPQYGPGHLDRVRRARAALAAHPIAIAGAAVDGVGIPACIASGRAAAVQLIGPA